MMHGTEQSDLPIVPRKPVNKAAQAGAESAEGSGGTKRNADLQSTDRTQSRDAVSQAQGRIRDAVRSTVPRHALKVGAECLNWARSDLCGGWPEMAIPTAMCAGRPAGG